MRIKLTDLAPGVEYAIQVMALNDEGMSPWSKTFTFITSFDDVPPVEPTGLVGTMSGTTFVLDWQPVVDSMDGTPAYDLSNYYVKVESPGSVLTKEYLVPAGETRFQFTLDMNRELFGSPRATIVMSVCAVDKTGNRSTYSSTVSQTNPPPSAPASIAGVELMDSVSLEWSEVDDDDLLGYAIYEGTTSGAQNTKVWSGPGTSALIPSTTYVTDKWYKVFAVDVFGTQSLTGPVAGPLRPKSPFTVDSTAPGVPTGLAGTIATTVDRAALNVSWTNGANPDNDLAGTVIGYRPVGSTDWSYTTVDYTLSSTRIENITPYVNYEIRARAYDWSANYSAWTNTVTTNTAATNTAPPTVTGVAITAGLDSVTVSWAESTADDVKNGAGVYLVQIATNNTFTTGLLQYRTGATQISVTGLAQNQTYYARVKAVDSAGLQSASWSTVVNAGTGDYPEGNPFSYTVSATAPSDPDVGDIWMDTSSGFEKQWNGSNWVNTGNASIDYVNGQTGNLVKNYVTEYSVNSSETVAPTTGWSTATPTRTPGTFIWYRVVVTYGDDTTSTTSPALLTGNTGATGSQGIPGEDGADGQSLYTWLKYADTPTTGMSDSPAGKTYIGLAYNKTTPTESTNYGDYAWSLIKGDQGIPGEPGEDGVTTYTWVKYADNSSGGGMSDSPTGKTYIGLAFNKPTPTESTTTTDYAWSLIQGPQGAPAPIVSLTATTQVLTSPATGGATTPTTSVVTGTPTNTTITVWQYSVNGAAFSNTVPTGVSRTGNVVTITGSTMTAKTITVRMADANGVADTLTVAKVLDGATGATGDPGDPGLPGDPGDPGADAFTVLLTNESHTFPGSTTAALAGNTTTNVIAYEGATLSNATIGTITGQVTGLTTSVTGSGTTNPTITITVTTSLTTKSGTLTIPVTVNGVTFTKRFSWSLALQGSQGIQGLPGDDGTTYYTWLKYADTPTTGMSDSPTGKTYMGIAVNKTSPTESTTYSDYTWSLIKGDQGIPGEPGDDGITYYTWIKYGTSAAGAGLSDDPTGRPYIGIAYNKTTATESTTPGDYTWSLIQGAPGSDGSDGVGITSVTPYFYRITAGSAAPAKPTASPPPSPWTATEPDYLANTELYRTERILYTDASFAYTNVSKVSAYTAAVTAIASANGKNKTIHSTSAASGTTGYVAGDTWFRYDGSNNIIAQWRYSGSAWVSEQVGSDVIANLDAGKLTANSAFITTLNIGSGGVIQSAGYTSGGTSGFQLSNTGLTIKGTGNVVDVGAVSAGTITAKTWNVGAGGVINVDSTGQIKSNNYAANSTGYKLSSSGLEINDGSIDAKALRTNTAVIGDLTIGQSANTLGSIKSFGYVAGTTGWKLDKSGLELNTGSVSAAALKIQNGHNMMPPAYADFEYGDAYYTNPFWTPRGQGKMYTSSGLASANKYNPANPNWKPFAGTQYMGVTTLTGTSAVTVWFGETATDYNIEVVPGEKYILSGYFQNISANNTQWNLTVKGNNGTTFTTFPIDLGGGVNQTAYTRVWTTVTVPAGVTKVLVGLSNTNTTLSKSLHVDALQFEPKVGALDTPSIWKPPATTTVNPSGITTGLIRSSADVTVNGTTMPMWSINMAGNIQVGDALVRGKLLVGLSGDPDAGNSYISSGNFVTGATGWKIDSAGNAELNNGTFRGTVDGGTFTGDNFVSSGSIYAGTLGGNHTEISSTGLYVYTNTPNEGTIETMRLGSNTGDYFAITDSTGTETATIGSDGGASFNSVSISERIVDVEGTPVSGLFVYGKEFKDWIDEGPRGMVAAGILPVSTTIQTNSTIFTLSFEAQPGRTYKVHIPSILARCSTQDVSRGWALGLEIPESPGSSTLVGRGIIAWGYGASNTPNAFYSLPSIDRILRCSASPGGGNRELNAGTCVIKLSTNATSASPVEIYGTSAYQKPMIYVEDIGPDIDDTGAYVYEAPATPPIQTYTSTWVSNSSEAYNGSNAPRSNTNDLVQGDIATGNGNCHGLILFTGANSTGSQSGITVATALSGATIKKVEVYLYANHWYYGSGGTARIIPDNQSSLAGFTPTGNQKLVTGWGRSVGKWVDITSAVTGSGGVGTGLRSVCIGKAPSSDYIYYGRFNAHNQSYPPKLRITYTK